MEFAAGVLTLRGGDEINDNIDPEPIGGTEGLRGEHLLELGWMERLSSAEGDGERARGGLVVAREDGRAVELGQLNSLVAEPSDAVDEHAL